MLLKILLRYSEIKMIKNFCSKIFLFFVFFAVTGCAFLTKATGILAVRIGAEKILGEKSKNQDQGIQCGE